MPFEQTLTSDDELRGRYGATPGPIRRKVIDHVDDGAAEFISLSPFFVLATSSDRGSDASPRGGPAGFVKILDPHRIAFADLAGNRLLDSFTNLVHQPHVGLIFMIPGMDETLRVNGRASLTVDPAVLEACQIGDRPATTAVGVDIDQVYIHCAKAFRRAGVWDPASWLAPGDRPSAACILRDHVNVDVDPQIIDDELEKDYAATMWEAGA